MPPTLLCVDADRSYCEVLARAFRAEGYAVRTAHDGERALELIRESRPDLVTLDLLLPRRDGFSVLEEIRASGDGHRLPVLLLSGCRASDSYRARAARLEASALLTKPVPLERLLFLVAQQLGKAPEVAPRERPRPPARPLEAPARPRRITERARPASPRRPAGTARMEGSLREVPFAALLHHLHGLRASGVLHLQNGRKKKKLQLGDGRPVAVKSNLVGETLGELLVASGRITRDVLHHSLLRVQQGEGLHGQILMAMHMLDEQDLAQALRIQAEEKLYEIFGWADGQFRFQRGVRVRGANTLSLKGSPGNLIVQGVRTRVPAETIDAFFKEYGDARIAPSTRPFYAFQEIDLDDVAEALLGSIDGTGTLSDLLPLDERSRRLLYAWHAVELVEVERPTDPPVASSHFDLPGPPARRRDPRADPDGPPHRDAAPAPEPEGAREPERPLPRRAREVPRRPARERAPVSAPVLEVDPEAGVRAELAEIAARMRGRDAFEVLGVQRSATDQQIRDAYFALAKTTHPDRFSSSSESVRRLAEEVFAIVSAAWDGIGTRVGRAAYVRAEREAQEDREAREEGERAVRAELAFQKGVASLNGKAYPAAVALFREAVQLYPDEGEYHAYLGWALYLESPKAIGRLKEAQVNILRGRKLAPDSEKPYLFLGRIFRAEGLVAKAEKMFHKVIQLDPDCVDAIRELRLMDMRRQKSKSLVGRILRR